MKQRITKYLLAAVGLVFTGEAYLIIDELRQLRQTASAAISMANEVNQALSSTTQALTTVVVTQRKLVVAANQASGQCRAVEVEMKKVGSEVRKLQEDVQKVLKILGR